MKRKTKIVILAVLILIPVIWVWWFMHISCIRAGIVLDAVTDKPVSNAIVCYYWEIGGYFSGKAGGKLYETTTDKNGKYFIPAQIIKRKLPYEAAGLDGVLIYKDGYAGYVNGRSFYDTVTYRPFRGLYSTVKLYPWREGERSHSAHLAFIGAQFPPHAQIGPLLEAELKNLDKEAVNENQKSVMERRVKH